MWLSSVRCVYVVASFLWVHSWFSEADQVQRPNKTVPAFPALLVFGDSIVDTGNNNNLITVAKSNFPPYGKDFIGHQPTGRFSNGKVPSDLLASGLGVKELLPAYLSSELSNEDLLTGVCFASGAAGYDPLTSKVASALSMWDQLELFKDYKKKVDAIAGEGRAVEIINQSIYLICTGSNDITNTYYGTHLREAHYDFPTYSSFLVQSAASFVMELYNLGARNIIVVGLPPLGCIPSQRTLAGGSERNCVTLYNQASQQFNHKLSLELQMLQKNLPGSRFVYADIFERLLNVIQHPSDYGFEVSKKGCCGTGEIEASILCNIKSTTCADDSKYIFWDSFHPTQKAYEIIVGMIIQEDIPLFF